MQLCISSLKEKKGQLFWPYTVFHFCTETLYFTLKRKLLLLLKNIPMKKAIKIIFNQITDKIKQIHRSI